MTEETKKNPQVARFVPLDLDLIDEGHFGEQLLEAFVELQVSAIEHAQEHKKLAKGATCKLTAEITLKCEDPESEYFSIKTHIKKTEPPKPASVTTAMGQVGQDDKLRLFVKRTGSAKGNPQQSVFADLAQPAADN